MRLVATTIAILAMSSICHAKGKHLFILSGQSNMARFNPDMSFTPAVEKAFGKSSVIVVKDAHSGQPIKRWYKEWKPAAGSKVKGSTKNGDLYERLMKKVNAAIKGQKVASVTFVWMQGESDAKMKQGDVYEASLNGLIEQLKKDLGIKSLHLVIGRISDFDMENKKFQHWTKVRDALVKVAESAPSGTWVDTDDLNDITKGKSVRNDLHYTKEGYKTLGERYAEKAITLIKKK